MWTPSTRGPAPRVAAQAARGNAAVGSSPLLKTTHKPREPRCRASDEHELVAAVDEAGGMQADERVDSFHLIADRANDLLD